MGAIPIFGTDGAQRRASGTWGTRGYVPLQILATLQEAKLFLQKAFYHAGLQQHPKKLWRLVIALSPPYLRSFRCHLRHCRCRCQAKRGHNISLISSLSADCLIIFAQSLACSSAFSAWPNGQPIFSKLTRASATWIVASHQFKFC